MATGLKPALNRLRLRLTLLYVLAGSLLVLVMGGGAYAILSAYFQTTTDQILEARLAEELLQFGRTAAIDRTPSGVFGLPRRSSEEGEEEEASGEERERPSAAERATTFALLVTASGQILSAAPVDAPRLTAPVDLEAAEALGIDRRTVQTGGITYRLLTYRVPNSTTPAFVQVGRPLTDQERARAQLLTGVVVLGGFSTVALALASWWLAGRTLRPAQIAWDRQQAFIADAGHELRAPLTLLRASAEVARQDVSPADEDLRALLDDVLVESDHLARLVDDLLLLARLDSGRLTVAREQVPVGPLLDDLSRQVSRLAGEKGVRVQTDASTVVVLGDPTRLRQALLILLDNALRFTPSGGTIRLSAVTRGNRGVLSVEDTGQGIPAAHLPHIFDRFYQVDSARTGSHAGLGLAIARTVVEAQGGRIAATSRSGAGTRVEISLPAG